MVVDEAEEERSKPIICKVESFNWGFWISWKPIELLSQTEADSSQDLDLISTISVCHPKLIPISLTETEHAPFDDEFLAESHQFPLQIPLWNSSAMSIKVSSSSLLPLLFLKLFFLPWVLSFGDWLWMKLDSFGDLFIFIQMKTVDVRTAETTRIWLTFQRDYKWFIFLNQNIPFLLTFDK